MRVNLKATNATKAQIAIKKNPGYIAIHDKTPEEIETWVESNVLTMADVKKLLTLMLQFMNETSDREVNQKSYVAQATSTNEISER